MYYAYGIINGFNRISKETSPSNGVVSCDKKCKIKQFIKSGAKYDYTLFKASCVFKSKNNSLYTFTLTSLKLHTL